VAPPEIEQRIAAALVFRPEVDDWPVPALRDFVRYLANIVEEEIDSRYREAIDVTEGAVRDDFREGFIDT